jgi:HK97 family phage portal protein
LPNLWQRVKRFFNPYDAWGELDDRWYLNSWPQETASGAKIDESNALTISAVWACVRILSEDIGSLPLHLYIRREKGKEKATNNPLYYLLHDRPNPEMTALSFRETLASHILLWGNAYAEIERDGGNNIRALWPISPHRVEVWRADDNNIYYLVLDEQTGEKVPLAAEQILHVPGLSGNGLVGYSPIGKMREAVGMASALEEFGARFFGNGTHPGAVVSHPGKLGELASKNLRDSLTSGYSGLGKSHRLLLLEEGMKLETIGIPPEDAQFLETRRFQLAEIARIYKMPLHKLQEYEKGMAFASVEQFSLDYVVHTLRPWLVRFEQVYNWKLFSNDTLRRRYFFEHLVDGLLRGDLDSRYKAYSTGRNGGWLSANDVRELENMNPIPDGDIYLQPLNMVEVGAEPPQPSPSPQPPNKGNGQGELSPATQPEGRCLKCNKLLFKGFGDMEIICPKCGARNIITDMNHQVFLEA